MKVYNGFDPTHCEVSEKFDGICAIWDGRELRTRTGNLIDAPGWFTAGLPNCELRGDLWAGRGGFQTVLSICTSAGAGDRWKAIRFMVFDGPTNTPLGDHAEHVKRFAVADRAALDAARDQIVGGGGEGVVVRDPAGVDWKHKPEADDDALVISHVPSRNPGQTGSLLVRDRDGLEFRLGGLTSVDRRYPPAVGSVISFTHQGRHASGKPRSAAFLGRRAETTLDF